MWNNSTEICAIYLGVLLILGYTLGFCLEVSIIFQKFDEKVGKNIRKFLWKYFVWLSFPILWIIGLVTLPCKFIIHRIFDEEASKIYCSTNNTFVSSCVRPYIKLTNRKLSWLLMGYLMWNWRNLERSWLATGCGTKSDLRTGLEPTFDSRAGQVRID